MTELDKTCEKLQRFCIKKHIFFKSCRSQSGHFSKIAPPAPRGNLPTTPCDIPPPHGVALLHDNSPPCGNLPLHDSSPSHGHTSPCEHAPSHSNSPPRAFSDSPSCSPPVEANSSEIAPLYPAIGNKRATLHLRRRIPLADTRQWSHGKGCGVRRVRRRVRRTRGAEAGEGSEMRG